MSAGAASRWSHAPVGSAGVGTGCSAVSRSARSVAMVSIDSSMSKEPSTCSITSWSTVPLAADLQHLVPLDAERAAAGAADTARPASRRVRCRASPTARPGGRRSDRAPARRSPARRLRPTMSSSAASAALLEVCSTVAACSASDRGSGPRSLSRRTRSGRVNPWSSSVPVVTTIAANTSNSCCGTSVGMTSAAARVDHSAHPGPADDQGVRPRWRFVLGIAVASEEEGPGRRHPEQPDDDHPDEDGGAERGDPQPGELGVRYRADDAQHLQPDQEEHGVLQEQLDRGPVDPLAEPRLPGLDDRRLVTEDQARDHHGDHARTVVTAHLQLLGRQVRRKRHDQRDRRVEGRLGDPSADRDDDEGQRQADRSAAHQGDEEAQRRTAGRHRADRWRPGRPAGR